MQVFIAGSGKLAAELLNQLPSEPGSTVSAWGGEPAGNGRSIVVHAGSGREIASLSAYCRRTASVLVELATGSSLEEGAMTDFPLVLCPNTNILMLKFMCMLERSGPLFRQSEIRITESHQASKTSVPGTAVAMANSLGVPATEIVSVRAPAEQASALGIPHEHLARHAFHRIEIQDGACQIAMETRIYGDSPYANGVQQILSAIRTHELQARVYRITEFIDQGWV
jgi:4-hydroxy-tetrahydrodipicolinate reductase